MEDLARSVPLPPLLLNCRTSTEENVETGKSEQVGTSVVRKALGPPSADRNKEEEEGEVCQALLSSGGNSEGGIDVKVSVHTVSEKVVSEDKEAEMGLHVPGSRTSVSYESNI